MGFCDERRKKYSEMWDSEKQHPFITGIGDGTLPLENFKYYMRQDYVFLTEFCRTLGTAVSKAHDLDDMAWFARLLHDTLNIEMSLHVEFCGEFGITARQLKGTTPSPTTMAYTRHLLASAASGGAAEIAMAILPCSWGYSEIGQMLHQRGLPADQPLFCKWIEMYSSTEFADLAAWLRLFIDRETVNKSERDLRHMDDLFLHGSRYELMFWDAAYRMENWPE